MPGIGMWFGMFEIRTWQPKNYGGSGAGGREV